MVPDALLLTLGAAAALGVAAALRRTARQPVAGLADGVGLVLLLVAALRGLGEAASQAAGGQWGLVAAGLALGVAGWLLLPVAPRVRGTAGAVAVVLAQVPLLLALEPFDALIGVQVDTFGPSPAALLALAGLLAGGAVAACRPPVAVAATCLPLLAGAVLLVAAVDGVVLGAGGSALSAAVLVPLLLERASAPAGPWRGRGALLGVVLVLLAAAVPDAVGTGLPRRYAEYSEASPGLQVLSNEQYSSWLTLSLDGPALVPGLRLLLPGVAVGLPG